jgi:2',3'-cyclic-nucleotide 2'-phosphodiesterase
MRLLFLGDMVGKTGRTAVWEKLPGLISDLKLDFVIVNGENAAGGFGITEDIYLETINAGADVVTTGNHVWDQKEAVGFAGRHDQFLRPANYPAGTPGKGSGLYYARNGARVLVANIMGRVFMHPELDDPFKSAEAILEAAPLKDQADAIVFDFHAEATSEKQCFGHFVDSSLGMDKEEPLNRFISKMPKGRFEAASGPATICGLGIEISDATGLAEKIEPIRIGPRLAENIPSFWR